MPCTTIMNCSRATALVLLASLMVASFSLPASAQWPQWGGPNRDFISDATGLADQWPEQGPKQVWSRDLGDGYSAIVVDQGHLYTMYRDGKEEVVVALEADTGKTVWEHRYQAVIPDEFDKSHGVGPRSTPTTHNGKVYTTGAYGQMYCLDAKSGKPVWSHNLVKDFGAKQPYFGFASSPVVYKETLIASVGGEGVGMIAFDLNSGSVIWKKHDFVNTYSSPIIINVSGEDQVVLLVDREIVGLKPTNGNIRWRHEHVNQWKTNISTPLWTKGNLLYVTSGGDAGSRVLKLTRGGNKIYVKEVWANRKVGVGQSNVILVGDTLYGGAGHGASSHIAALNLKTGDAPWKERGYTNPQMIYADGKIIVLDESGKLTLATPSADGLKVLSSAQVFTDKAWTIPTLVGTQLYLRNGETIQALDIG